MPHKSLQGGPRRAVTLLSSLGQADQARDLHAADPQDGATAVIREQGESNIILFILLFPGTQLRMSDPKEALMFMSRDSELHSSIELQKHEKNLTRAGADHQAGWEEAAQARPGTA